MKAQFILTCAAAAGIAVSGFSTVPASAERGVYWDLKFSADVVQPGDSVDVIAMCANHEVKTAPVRSSVLDAPDLRAFDGPDGWNLISHAKVKKGVVPETYPVSFRCGQQLVTRQLRVAGAEIKPGPPRVSLIHTKGRPGQEIWVGAYCKTPVTLSSAALTIGAITREPDGRAPDLPLFGANAKVKNVKPGPYKVTAKCDGKTLSATFTVLGASNVTGQVPVKPKGAPETGGGDA